MPDCINDRCAIVRSGLGNSSDASKSKYAASRSVLPSHGEALGENIIPHEPVIDVLIAFLQGSSKSVLAVLEGSGFPC